MNREHLLTLSKDELTEYVKGKQVLVTYSTDGYYEGGFMTLCHMDLLDGLLYNVIRYDPSYVLDVKCILINKDNGN